MEIKGIIPPIITPMNRDESINFHELKKQIRRQLDAGVHGIFALGTNGEGYILSEREKIEVLSTVVEEVNHKVPVYAGTGCVSTQETIRLSQKAEALGVDILSIITPSFAQASQHELIEHYEQIAKETQTPIILYNIPARTGNALTPGTIAELAKVDGIVGVKDSSGNFDNMLQYIEVTQGDDFAVLSGNDSLILWNLMAGGQGGVAGCANVYPKNMVNIYEAFQRGDIASARVSQDNIRSFRNCFKFGNPNTIVKKAVNMLGYDVGDCRKPFHHIGESGITTIQEVLEQNKGKGME